MYFTKKSDTQKKSLHDFQVLHFFPGKKDNHESGYGRISKLPTDQNSYLTPIPRVHFIDGTYDNENNINKLIQSESDDEACENTKLLAENAGPAERTKGCDETGKVAPSREMDIVINNQKNGPDSNQRDIVQYIV